MYKLKHNIVPEIFLLRFLYNKQIYTIPTCNNSSYHLPFFSKCITQQSIMFKGVKTWNSLPAKVRQGQSISIFTALLKDFLYENQTIARNDEMN